jgi:hypothetical protein
MTARRHDESLPAEERARLGAHYTPEALADELAQVALAPHLAWDPALPFMPSRHLLRLTIVDPACGDGALLAAAVRCLTPILIACMDREGLPLRPKQAARLLQRRCVGNDVDAGAVAHAQRLLPWATFSNLDALFDFDVDPQGGPLMFIGNPPFLGGGKISSKLGQEYLQRIKARFPSFKGRTDLCALFFLAAADIINRTGVDGTISFIATKTISEGDTREAGLGVLCQPNETGVWTIWNAWKSRPWPDKANVCIAIVHLMHERMGRRRGFARAIDETYQRFLGAVPDRRRFRIAVDPPTLAPAARVAVALDGKHLGLSEAV